MGNQAKLIKIDLKAVSQTEGATILYVVRLNASHNIIWLEFPLKKLFFVSV